MNFDEFVGQVQHRAGLPEGGAAVAATRATLETLAERLAGGMDENLAAQLPREIGEYLRRAPEESDSFSLDEFFRRVAEREGERLPDAVYHARVVMEVVREAVAPGLVGKLEDQLPDEFQPLLQAGSGGQMDRG